MSTEYKQPHEDVVGIDRSENDLLSLDERAVAHRDALIAVAAHLYAATIVGNPAPSVRRMGDRMRALQIGDLVVEDGARFPRRDAADTRLKGFGYLLAKRIEWSQTDEDHAAWLAEDPDAARYPRSTVEAWYIQYGSNPEAICRWANCSFVVVPVDINLFREPVGTSDGTGVTITRASLLGSLADSGFEFNR